MCKPPVFLNSLRYDFTPCKFKAILYVHALFKYTNFIFARFRPKISFSNKFRLINQKTFTTHAPTLRVRSTTWRLEIRLDKWQDDMSKYRSFHQQCCKLFQLRFFALHEMLLRNVMLQSITRHGQEQNIRAALIVWVSSPFFFVRWILCIGKQVFSDDQNDFNPCPYRFTCYLITNFDKSMFVFADMAYSITRSTHRFFFLLWFHWFFIGFFVYKSLSRKWYMEYYNFTFTFVIPWARSFFIRTLTARPAALSVIRAGMECGTGWKDHRCFEKRELQIVYKQVTTLVVCF